MFTLLLLFMNFFLMVMTHLSRETRTVTILEYKHSKFTKDAESEHADVNTNN